MNSNMFGLFTAEINLKTNFYQEEQVGELGMVQSQEFSVSLRDGKGTTYKIRGIPTEITTTYGEKAFPLTNGYKDYEVTFLVAADYLEERGQTEAAKILREACK